MKILFKHALRNAILPVITYVGPMLAGLMTGSFVVEKIFSSRVWAATSCPPSRTVTT